MENKFKLQKKETKTKIIVLCFLFAVLTYSGLGFEYIAVEYRKRKLDELRRRKGEWRYKGEKKTNLEAVIDLLVSAKAKSASKFATIDKIKLSFFWMLAVVYKVL